MIKYLKQQGNLPVYIVSAISALIALTSGLIVFIYQSNASAVSSEIKENKELDAKQEGRITTIEADIRYIKDGQDKANVKLDRILYNFI